jgi:hypothetical protein
MHINKFDIIEEEGQYFLILKNIDTGIATSRQQIYPNAIFEENDIVIKTGNKNVNVTSYKELLNKTPEKKPFEE